MSLPIELPFSLPKLASFRSSRSANGPDDTDTAISRHVDMQAAGDLSDGARNQHAVQLARDYYNLVTDFYERGWGQSFHFAPRVKGESYRESILAYNHKVAHMLRLEPGMLVADVGAGIGGPMRDIARFSGATIKGINTNAYQIEKGERYNQEAGLERITSFIEGNFLDMPVPDVTFDAAYAIEATCHAPSAEAVYKEIYRTLKPGSLFFLTDWCMTDLYDEDNPEHVRIRKEIEKYDGLPTLRTVAQSRAALEKAGFEILEEDDWAQHGDKHLKWYSSLAAEELDLTGVRRTKVGQFVMGAFVKALELLGIAPKGTREVQKMLNAGADALVEGGRTGLFTPSAMFLCRKPDHEPKPSKGPDIA